MDDPRPILWCRECEHHVVTMPNGRCQWCDHQIRVVEIRMTLLLHQQRLSA